MYLFLYFAYFVKFSASIFCIFCRFIYFYILPILYMYLFLYSAYFIHLSASIFCILIYFYILLYIFIISHPPWRQWVNFVTLTTLVSIGMTTKMKKREASWMYDTNWVYLQFNPLVPKGAKNKNPQFNFRSTGF